MIQTSLSELRRVSIDNFVLHIKYLENKILFKLFKNDKNPSHFQMTHNEDFMTTSKNVKDLTVE